MSEEMEANNRIQIATSYTSFLRAAKNIFTGLPDQVMWHLWHETEDLRESCLYQGTVDFDYCYIPITAVSRAIEQTSEDRSINAIALETAITNGMYSLIPFKSVLIVIYTCSQKGSKKITERMSLFLLYCVSIFEEIRSVIFKQ